ncbi:MAG: hypothetical protein RQ862_11460 [Candidatus Caldarchaeales archaeon]|nr:hypothetical protein [Candidatus Caldarchaeales archaeon]
MLICYPARTGGVALLTFGVMAMKPQKTMQYCAEVLKEMGFEIELRGNFLYYKDEPLLYWVQKAYPIDEVECYRAFVVVSQIWEDGEREIPEEVENAEDILVTYCIAAIIHKEVFRGISSAYFEDSEKFCFCLPYPSRLTIEIPFYKSEEDGYYIIISWDGEKGVEKVKPIDFDALRKVVALELL